jgi:hypothetical protein
MEAAYETAQSMGFRCGLVGDYLTIETGEVSYDLTHTGQGWSLTRWVYVGQQTRNDPPEWADEDAGTFATAEEALETIER